MAPQARHPRAAHRLLVTVALALWTSAVYLTATGPGTASAGAGLVQAPPAATEAEARQRCGTACHRFPAPDVLPRAAWRDELVRMQLLMDGVPEPAGMRGTTTAMIPLPPDMLRIQRFYEAAAPESLAAPAPWPAPATASLSFTRTPVALAGAVRVTHPAVANVRLLDVGGDASPEIVASDMRAGVVMAGRPGDPAGLRVIAEVPHPSHIERVDLDADGLPDLLVGDLGSFQPADHSSGAIVWLRRSKAGTYTPIVIAERLGRVADVRAADFDGDGDLDLVAAVFGWRRSGSLILFENRTTDWKTPTFVAAELDARHGAIHAPVTDVNGDGRPDIVVLFAQEHETIVAFVNSGKGTFRTETIFQAPHPNWGSSGIDLVDLDKDGDLDVLHTHGDTFDDFILKPYHGITWLENKGSFPYVEHAIAALPGAHRAQAADLDGDGDLDIAAAALVAGGGGAQEATLPAVVWLEQTSPGQWVRHAIKIGSPAHATLDIGDVDRDGRPDLVVGSFAFGPAMDSMVDVWKNLRR